MCTCSPLRVSLFVRPIFFLWCFPPSSFCFPFSHSTASVGGAREAEQDNAADFACHQHFCFLIRCFFLLERLSFCMPRRGPLLPCSPPDKHACMSAVSSAMLLQTRTLLCLPPCFSHNLTCVRMLAHAYPSFFDACAR